MHGPRRLLVSPRAAERIAHASAWLAGHGSSREVLIVGATVEAAGSLARSAAAAGSFGWHRSSLTRLAGALAEAPLASRARTPAGALALEALAARMLHLRGAAGAGRFAAILDRPGLPRALARTMDELRLAGVDPASLDADLAALFGAYDAEREKARLADRAEAFALATEIARGQRHPLLGHPLLLLDVAVGNARERELVSALASRTEAVLATVPSGDARTIANLEEALGVRASAAPSRAETTGLARLQSRVFSDVARDSFSPGDANRDDVMVLSAPGESRECVEIARLVHRFAGEGVRFDRMAILLRSPESYRTHLEEALRRAGVPAFSTRGARRPDPAGRAFLALLACAAEGLSARRFAEYLSLGEVPRVTADGAPPAPAPSGERWAMPDEELTGGDRSADDEPTAEPRGDTLRAPRLWEHLIVEASVIGGIERWGRRLDGLRGELELDRASLDPDHPRAGRVSKDLAALESLRRFALPVLDALARLPRAASWSLWLDALSALASSALAEPARVQVVLAELAPMADVGPVELDEVRIVLERRLGEMVVRADVRPEGRVFVGSPDEARGLAFDVVFVPGLAEKLFPRKVTEDPILTDAARAKLGGALRTNADRSAAERLALRLAVGAATKRIVVSYPRLDLEQSRPRTPSFYALEVLRAAEGALPGFDELARRAEIVGAARVGWPAPASPRDAIDEAEHDLALLDAVLARPEAETVGAARYLLAANPHLARALRFRARRSLARWNHADGLVDPASEALPALAAHSLSARSFSPTALQQFAACPYRFVLHTIHKLAPRTEPSRLEELDPLQRGSLVHETLYELHHALRAEGALPITWDNLAGARARLDDVLGRVAARFADDLAPAIPRVWDDGIAAIKADLREWLRRAAEDTEWMPRHFELSFGLAERRARDPRSVDEPVVLASGLMLRGSIDLVEARASSGALRATDYKTGKAWVKDGAVVGGGETLQPVLYALALEKLLGQTIEGGRLYYCTASGGFEAREIPLDEEARASAGVVAKAVGEALTTGFFPAAPAKGACERCDYRRVCGPHEERRAATKRKDRLASLDAVRKLR